MPDRYQVAPREVLGKKVARLRREGVLPAIVYGRGKESVAVQLPARQADEILSTNGLNGLIEIEVEGEPAPRPAVVRVVQRHPLTRDVLHLDFYEVDLTRPIQAMVPITLLGEAPAVHTYQGILIQGADHVQVEALPADLPSHLELSVDSLTELEQSLTVADLQVEAGVQVLTDPEQMLVLIQTPRKIEEVEEEELLEGEEALEGEEGAEAAAEGEGESDSDGDDSE